MDQLTQIETVCHLVCSAFSVSFKDVISPSHYRMFAQPRFMISKLLHDRFRLTDRQIATLLGGRVVSGAWHMRKAAARELASDKRFAAIYTKIITDHFPDDSTSKAQI